MAHNSGFVPDAAVRIGWPDAVLLGGQRSRVQRCHPFGHRLMRAARRVRHGVPPRPGTECSHARPTVHGSEFVNPAGSMRTAGNDSISS